LQTAKALNVNFEVVQDLAPGASATDIIAAADWPDSFRRRIDRRPFNLRWGWVASTLIAGRPMPWSIKKAALSGGFRTGRVAIRRMWCCGAWSGLT